MNSLLWYLVVIGWMIEHNKVLTPSVKNVAKQKLGEFQTQATKYGVSKSLLRKWTALVNSTSISESAYDTVYDVGMVVKSILDKAKKDPKVTLDQQSLLGVIGTFLRNVESEAAYKRFADNVGLLGEPILESLFAVDTKIDKKMQLKLSQLTKKLGGRGDKLSLDEQKAVSQNLSKASTYKEYLATNLALNRQYKQALASLIRSNKGKSILLSEAIAKLSKYGIPPGWWPQIDAKHGFRVSIDKKGNPALLTATENQVQQFPRGDAKIIVNPNYDHQEDSNYVFKLQIPGALTENRIYTHRFYASQKSNANNKVMSVLPKMKNYVAKWEKSILNSKTVDDALPALMTYLVYQLSCRIGNENQATAGETTYGLSTLLGKHVQVGTQTATFTYPGKKGVSQRHIFTNKNVDPRVYAKVMIFLRKLKDRAKSNKPFFAYEDGVRCTERDVNNYMKSSGIPITAHKLRHVRGTSLFNDLVSSKKFSIPRNERNPQKHAETWLKENVLKKVGSLLGHKNASGEDIGTTAAKSYIVPSVMKDWFTDKRLKPPAFIPKHD